jgi:hypothetical protein
MSEPGMFSFFWPEVDDSASARVASNLGATASGIVAFLTLGTVALALFLRHVPISASLAPALIEAAIFSALAWGIWRGSRVAALAALILYVLDYVIVAVNTSWTAGIIMHAAISICLLSGVRGTFGSHRYRDSAASDATTDS